LQIQYVPPWMCVTSQVSAIICTENEFSLSLSLTKGIKDAQNETNDHVEHRSLKNNNIQDYFVLERKFCMYFIIIRERLNCLSYIIAQLVHLQN